MYLNPDVCSFGVKHFYQFSPQLVLELRATIYNALKRMQELKIVYGELWIVDGEDKSGPRLNRSMACKVMIR